MIGRQKIRRKLTLIIARTVLTEPKRALAGAILESFFARFKVSMAVFNADIAPSRPLGRWDLTSMDETRTRGGHERTVQRGGYGECPEGLNPNRAERRLCHVHLAERNCICSCYSCSAEGCRRWSADRPDLYSLRPIDGGPASGSDLGES